jgi:hypothetical protein
VLYLAVGLPVVGRGLHVPDAQDAAEAVPDGRGELAPPVGGDDCRHAIPCNPTLRENKSTRFCRNVRKRKDFKPPCVPVNDSEHIGGAL